jgi:hypothetical protein
MREYVDDLHLLDPKEEERRRIRRRRFMLLGLFWGGGVAASVAGAVHWIDGRTIVAAAGVSLIVGLLVLRTTQGGAADAIDVIVVPIAILATRYAALGVLFGPLGLLVLAGLRWILRAGSDASAQPWSRPESGDGSSGRPARSRIL